MKKNITIVVILIVFFIIILIVSTRFKNKEEIINNENNNSFVNVVEDSGIYTIYNEKGEIITTTEDKDQVVLYQEQPDYNPTPHF